MRFDRTAVYARVPEAGTLRVAGGLSLGVGLAPVVVGGAGALAGVALDPGTTALFSVGIRVLLGVLGLLLLFGAARAAGDLPAPAVVVFGAVLLGLAVGSLAVRALVVPLGAGLAAVLPPGVDVESGVLELFAIGIHLLAASAGATALHAIGLFYRGSWAETGE